MSINPEQGGVCAPQGFVAAGLRCGIAKKKDKKDLALIYSKAVCSAAAVYTQNRVKAAPVTVTQTNLSDGRAHAVICNSGNANACTPDGEAVAQRMCAIAAKTLNIGHRDVVVASTGVIGQSLDPAPIEKAMNTLASALSDKGSADALAAIMTTDLRPKEIAVSFVLDGKTCKMGAIAKGSGMIHPNMATMLAFITTDAAIAAPMLQQALSTVVPDTFNMVSVDGDTSTNDMTALLANGLAGNALIETPGDSYDIFVRALTHICIYLARAIARDGEGATRLIECSVAGAKDDTSAKLLAKSVICSSLFKAAVFGKDANWGRVLCALGYSGAEFDTAGVKVQFASKAGKLTVCENGVHFPFSEDLASRVLGEEEIEILVGLGDGGGSAVAWGCDLTYDYVKINGDYRS
ncbi:MAG: bifunctional glutamate N-acetyltransferase/amino-acid acetyltransferase ArgJ [Oscillospiraceae bacterium]|jgi:glutamate N-acetyltransferase/amino-acid N-acetyltransferase|nr:bifunctional glutamate N-acetyltransferase/amino-acid acetyltransferase ArgJ [Oscillospiraceae bacterium]